MVDPFAHLPPSAPMPPATAVTFDDLERRAKQALEAVTVTSERLRAARFQAATADSAVVVEVDGAGTLVHIALDDAAMNLHASELSKRIVNLAQQAAERAVTAMKEQIAGLTEQLGESS